MVVSLMSLPLYILDFVLKNGYVDYELYFNMSLTHHEDKGKREEVDERTENSARRRRIYVSEHLCQLKRKCAVSLSILIVLFIEACIRRIEQFWGKKLK